MHKHTDALSFLLLIFMAVCGKIETQTNINRKESYAEPETFPYEKE